MPNYVFYDLETTDSALNHSQILQSAMILVNDELQELDRAVFHARLNPTFCPHPGALLTNKISVKDLKEKNLSEYEMVKQINSTLKKWGSVCSIGWNSVFFDRSIIRATMFRNLEKPYILNSNGSTEADLIGIARSSHLYYPGCINTGTTKSQNPEFKLTSISKENNIKHEKSHTALSDCEVTLDIARLLKKNAKVVWDASLFTTNKHKVLEVLDKDLMVLTNENYGGGPKPHLVSYLLPHPKWSWPVCWDLRYAPEDFLDLSIQHLKAEMKNVKPKFLRKIRHNAHPIFMNPSFFKNFEIYEKIGMPKLEERAKMVKKNKKLAEKVNLIIKEELEEKEQDSQLDIYTEDTIYTGGFPNAKDNSLMQEFNDKNDWKEKFLFKDRFSDPRYCYFANRLIYENSPDLLSKEEYKKIHRSFAERLFSIEKKPFTTFASAFKAIDDLRSNLDEDKDKEKLTQLQQINDFIMELQKKYENA